MRRRRTRPEPARTIPSSARSRIDTPAAGQRSGPSGGSATRAAAGTQEASAALGGDARRAEAPGRHHVEVASGAGSRAASSARACSARTRSSTSSFGQRLDEEADPPGLGVDEDPGRLGPRGRQHEPGDATAAAEVEVRRRALDGDERGGVLDVLLDRSGPR